METGKGGKFEVFARGVRKFNLNETRIINQKTFSFIKESGVRDEVIN